MRRLFAAALLVVALPGAVAAEPSAPDPGSSVVPLVAESRDVVPAVPDILLEESVVPLEESVVPLEEEERSGDEITIRISSDVLFEFDSADLTPSAEKHLASLAERLKGGEVRIDGYTDSLGGSSYNLRLSQRRANAVKDELARLGVTGLTARGHGEADPVAPNEIDDEDNPRGRAKNRRVEISFAS